MFTEKKYFVIYLLLSIALIFNVDLESFSYRGDAYFPIFPLDETDISLWNDKYHSGQTNFTNPFQFLPIIYVMQLFNNLGIPSYITQKIYFIFAMMLIQLSGFIFFKSFYYYKIDKKQNTLLVSFLIGLFFLLNPYILFKFSKGQIDVVIGIASIIFTLVFLNRLIYSRKKDEIKLFLFLIFISYFVFLQNFYLSFLYIITILFFLILNYKQIKEKLFYFILFLISISIIHSWVIFGTFNFIISSPIYLDGNLLDQDLKNINHNSNNNILYPISLLPNAIENIFPESKKINQYFLNNYYILINIIIFIITLFSLQFQKKIFIFKTGIIYILSLFFALGIDFNLFNLFYNFTDFFKIFRNPTKFQIIILICQGFLFGLAIVKFQNNKSKLNKNVITMFVILILLVRAGPFINGDFSGTLKGIIIPKEYYQVKNILDKDDENKVIALPLTTGALSYKWGEDYKGISFLGRFIKNPLFEIKYKDSANFYSLELLKNNKNKLYPLSKKLGIKYILLRKDINEFELINDVKIKELLQNKFETVFKGKYLELLMAKENVNKKFYCSDKITNKISDLLNDDDQTIAYLEEKKIYNKQFSCPQKILISRYKDFNRYNIKIIGKSQFLLNSTISYDKNWILKLNNQKKYKLESYFSDKYSNSWFIDSSNFINDELDLIVEYRFDKQVHFLFLLSKTIFNVFLIFTSIFFSKKIYENINFQFLKRKKL